MVILFIVFVIYLVFVKNLSCFFIVFRDIIFFLIIILILVGRDDFKLVDK